MSITEYLFLKNNSYIKFLILVTSILMWYTPCKRRGYMLEKTSHKLLKTLYKENFLTFDECHKICRTSDETGNPYASYLLNHGLIELHECDRSGEFNEADYDGYSITLDGAGLIYTEKRDFWMFLIPYVITTLIAFVALLVAMRESEPQKVFFFFPPFLKLL